MAGWGGCTVLWFMNVFHYFPIYHTYFSSPVFFFFYHSNTYLCMRDFREFWLGFILCCIFIIHLYVCVLLVYFSYFMLYTFFFPFLNVTLHYIWFEVLVSSFLLSAFLTLPTLLKPQCWLVSRVQSADKVTPQDGFMKGRKGERVRREREERKERKGKWKEKRLR